MGVLCRFSQYTADYDILGAVYLARYLQTRDGVPSKRWLQRKKTETLETLIQPQFVGTSFDVLRRTMAHFELNFELYFDYEVIIKVGDRPHLQLTTINKLKCDALQLVLSPLDILHVPDCLRLARRPRDAMSSLITRLDQVNILVSRIRLVLRQGPGHYLRINLC